MSLELNRQEETFTEDELDINTEETQEQFFIRACVTEGIKYLADNANPTFTVSEGMIKLKNEEITKFDLWEAVMNVLTLKNIIDKVDTSFVAKITRECVTNESFILLCDSDHNTEQALMYTLIHHIYRNGVLMAKDKDIIQKLSMRIRAINISDEHKAILIDKLYRSNPMWVDDRKAVTYCLQNHVNIIENWPENRLQRIRTYMYEYLTDSITCLELIASLAKEQAEHAADRVLQEGSRRPNDRIARNSGYNSSLTELTSDINRVGTFIVSDNVAERLRTSLSSGIDQLFSACIPEDLRKKRNCNGCNAKFIWTIPIKEDLSFLYTKKANRLETKRLCPMCAIHSNGMLGKKRNTTNVLKYIR